MKILFLLIALATSLPAVETSWGTIYNPTREEFEANQEAIDLQLAEWVKADKRHDTDASFRLALYPIQRAKALLEHAEETLDRGDTPYLRIQSRSDLEWGYQNLAKGDGLSHGTQGEAELLDAFNREWSKIHEKSMELPPN